MNTVLAGKICGGQSAALKRREKLSALGGIGARRAATWKNTGSFHGRVFITARWKLIGGQPFTAYDFLSVQMEQRHLADAAHVWELASLWGIVLAAALPVAGIGVRAWSAVFELSRKARSFAAKHLAMHKAVARLGDGRDELPVILSHIRHDELYLVQEHREWLRLLLGAEWFL